MQMPDSHVSCLIVVTVESISMVRCWLGISKTYVHDDCGEAQPRRCLVVEWSYRVVGSSEGSSEPAGTWGSGSTPVLLSR